MSLLGGQSQRGAQKRPHTGRPTQGKYHAEQHRWEKAHVLGSHAAAAAPEEVQLENSQEVQAESNDNQTGNHIDRSLVVLKKAPQSACQRAHGHEPQGIAHGPAGPSLFTAGKIGNIDRQHR